jgi:hypothetical protein
MTISKRASIKDVAAAVGRALQQASIEAVLTGGACATIYSDGACVSRDLDFIVRSGGTRAALDAALASVGFVRDHDRYLHPATPFIVEFPRGPLSIGDDPNIKPAEMRIGRTTIAALSPTDSCRDRLAAFYHWSDRQSLRSAVEIALRHRVSMATIRKWSEREGAAEKFGEFSSQVAAGRKFGRTRRQG